MTGSKKADRLRKARMAAGYRSASEAARSLGVSTATYIHHENGTRDFGEGAAAIYARRFHVTHSWLLLGDGEMRDEELAAQQAAEESERDQEERERREYIESLSSEERRQRRDDEKKRSNDEILKIAQELSFVPEILPEFTRSPTYVMRGWTRFVDLDDPVYHPIAAIWGVPKKHLEFELGTPPAQTMIFPVVGNANAPLLVHGDLAIINTGTDDIVADSFYLVADKVAPPQVRYLRVNLFSSPTTVTMFANATPDDKQVLELETISIIGKIVGRISRM